MGLITLWNVQLSNEANHLNEWLLGASKTTHVPYSSWANRQTLREIPMGTTSAGSTGQPLVLRLPHGIYAGITTKRDMSPEGEDIVGVGLVPDVEVVDDPAAIAEGRDVQLERAVEHLLRVANQGGLEH